MGAHFYFVLKMLMVTEKSIKVIWTVSKDISKTFATDTCSLRDNLEQYHYKCIIHNGCWDCSNKVVSWVEHECKAQINLGTNKSNEKIGKLIIQIWMQQSTIF